MPEAPAPGFDAAFAFAERLSREVGAMAGRLARFLAATPLVRETAVANGQAFLNTMVETTASIEEKFNCPVPLQAHPLDRLARALKFTPLEIDLLILAGMTHEHEGYASIMRSLNPRGEPYLSVGLAAQLFCQTLNERRELREILELGAAVTSGAFALSAEAPFFERNIIAAETLWPVMAGVDVWPPGLRPVTDPVFSAGLDDWLASAPIAAAKSALSSGELCLVLVTADSEAIAFERAGVLAKAAEVPVARIDFPSNPKPDAELLVGLHCIARGIAPVIKLAELEAQPSASQSSVFVPEFRGFPGPVVLCGRTGAVTPRGVRPIVTVAVDRIPAQSREIIWKEMLGELAGDATTLATRYQLESSAAAEVACDVRALAKLSRRAISLDDMADSVRTRLSLRPSAGLKLVRPAADWDQLVLPADRKSQLREALERLQHQSRVLDEWKFLTGRPGKWGVRMLFSGPPGTGKTLAAEVLARTLGVDLLAVDISRVVSKWIGETEKNLSEAFDAGERAQAVLLFDEADALFGKRTEISDAHDRYANLETAYLLSRMERFEGLAILSTNLRQNIDPAFVRRLEFIIDFDEPSAAERAALWRCHLPASAPLAADVDFKELAALYPIVGGMIRNAAVAAGFLAAANGPPLTRAHLVRAVRREYEKSGKAFPGEPADLHG